MSISEDQMRQVVKEAYEAGYHGSYDLMEDYVEAKIVELESHFLDLNELNDSNELSFIPYTTTAYTNDFWNMING